eukprot:tig00000405_g491.t1
MTDGAPVQPSASGSGKKYEIPSRPSLEGPGRTTPPLAITALNLFKAAGDSAGTASSDTAVLNAPVAPSASPEPATLAAGAATQPTASERSAGRKNASTKWKATVQVVAKQAEAVSTWKEAAKEGRTFRNLIAWSNSNILKYDVDKLLSYGFLVWADGTAITIRTLVSTLVYCALSTLLGYFRCPEDVPLSWGNRCVPVFGSEMLMLTSLVAFLLGMFCQLTFNRWWSTRERLQLVIGRTNNLSLMTSTMITGTDEGARRARKEVVRYCNCAHALLYMQAAGQEDIDSLVKRKLLTKAEAGSLRSLPSKYQIVYAWLSELLKECAISGRMLFPDTFLPQFQEQIATMRAGAGDVMMFLNCQIPYAYVHLLTFATKLHVLFIMVYAGGLIGDGFNKQSISMIVFGYIFLFVNRVIYEGLLTIHEVLVNPFGDDPDDFPKYVYQEILEQTSASLIDQANKMPSTRFFEKYDRADRERRYSNTSFEEEERFMTRGVPSMLHSVAPSRKMSTWKPHSMAVAVPSISEDEVAAALAEAGVHVNRRASAPAQQAPALPRRPSFPTMSGRARPAVFRNSSFGASSGSAGAGMGLRTALSDYPHAKSVGSSSSKRPSRSNSISGAAGVRSPLRPEGGPVLAVRPPSFGPGSGTTSPPPEATAPLPGAAPATPRGPRACGPAGLGGCRRGAAGAGGPPGGAAGRPGDPHRAHRGPERSGKRGSNSDGERSQNTSLKGSRSARTARSDREGKSARFAFPVAMTNGRRLPPIAPVALHVSPLPTTTRGHHGQQRARGRAGAGEEEAEKGGKAQTVVVPLLAPDGDPTPSPSPPPVIVTASPRLSNIASLSGAKSLPPLRLQRAEAGTRTGRAGAYADRPSARSEALSRASTARGLRSARSARGERHGSNLMDIAAQAAHAAQAAAAALNEIAALRMGVQEGLYGAPHSARRGRGHGHGQQQEEEGAEEGGGEGSRPSSEADEGPAGPHQTEAEATAPEEEEEEEGPPPPPRLKRSNSRFKRMLSFGGRFQLQTAVPVNHAF